LGRSHGLHRLRPGLGIGGFPRAASSRSSGRSHGKTTLALHVIAEARNWAARPPSSTRNTPWTRPMRQHRGGCGQPPHLPARFRRAGPRDRRGPRRSGAVDVIVVDSVAALVPKAELEGEMGDAHMGSKRGSCPGPAQAHRHRRPVKTCFIFVNQMREKIGIFIGNPETTTAAGRSSSTLPCGSTSAGSHRSRRATSSSQSGQGEDRQEQDGPALPDAEFDLIYGHGISREGDLVDCGVNFASSRRPGPGILTRANGSARAGITSRGSSRRAPSWPPAWSATSGGRPGSSRRRKRKRKARSSPCGGGNS